jgi:hypothetical protein
MDHFLKDQILLVKSQSRLDLRRLDLYYLIHKSWLLLNPENEFFENL